MQDAFLLVIIYPQSTHCISAQELKIKSFRTVLFMLKLRISPEEFEFYHQSKIESRCPLIMA